MFKNHQTEEEGDETAVEDAEQDAAEDVREVVHPQIHAGEGDRGGDQKRRKPDPHGTAP